MTGSVKLSQNISCKVLRNQLTPPLFVVQAGLWDGAGDGEVQLPGDAQHLEPGLSVPTRLGSLDTTQQWPQGGGKVQGER